MHERNRNPVGENYLCKHDAGNGWYVALFMIVQWGGNRLCVFDRRYAGTV